MKAIKNFKALICLIVIVVLTLGIVNYDRLRAAAITAYLVKAIEQEEVELESYRDYYYGVHIGEKDKKFIIKILKGNDKIITTDMRNTSGILCEYMIHIGDIELGFNGGLGYEKGRYHYLFCINEEDRIMYDKWEEVLKEKSN